MRLFQQPTSSGERSCNSHPVLVRELVDQGLIELDLLRQLPNGLAQLLGIECFEVWQFDHSGHGACPKESTPSGDAAIDLQHGDAASFADTLPG